jgi:cytoskeletal protein RodZ
MKNSVKSLLVAAAVTGLLGATVVPVAMADDQQKPAQTEKDKNSCKSANGCSGKADAKDAKSKKASKKDATKKTDAAKDKNSCKSANGCSAKDEKK